MKAKSVLLVDLGGEFGGVERYLVGLAELLRGEVSVYVLCVLPELGQRLATAGGTVILLPEVARRWRPLRFMAAAWMVPYLVWKHGVWTVQVNGFLEAALMLPARLLGRRTVYTRHGPFELEQYVWHRQPLRFLPRAIARLCVHLATQVVCVSETVGMAVAAIRPRVPMVVIPNWVAAQGEPQIVRTGAKRGLQVLCAGRLERYKGVHLAIDALRGAPGMRLTVAGDGPYRDELEAQAAGGAVGGAGARAAVELVGFQAEMAKFYEAADIFVMPSLGPEGMPMSSLEAMARGLPCVFSDLPVHREISDNGRGALLFRPGDVASLRSALMALAADWELRAKVGNAAYALVGERYTEERVRERYLQVFGGG